MAAYYNENNPHAAQWLRNLIAERLIAPGDVDERSIEDVRPVELAGYTQCHFFAGIGGWSVALRLAGWPDDRPVWTGSCPCQPFSAAGKGAGFADERHLWPAFFHLIGQCQPPTVLGEQVASKDGLNWLDLVRSDLEAEGYAFGAADLCAAGIGAPHIRQRLFWLADANSGNSGSWRGSSGTESAGLQRGPIADGCGLPSRLEHTLHVGRQRRKASAPGHNDDRAAPERTQGEHGAGVAGAHWLHQHAAGPTHGHWRAADWLLCRDAKWRPVEPGTFPLAHGGTWPSGITTGLGPTERHHVFQLALNTAAVSICLPHAQVRRAVVQVRGNLVCVRLTQRAVAGLAFAHRVVAQVIAHPAAFGAVVTQVAAHEHAAIGLVFHVAGHRLCAPGGWGPNPSVNASPNGGPQCGVTPASVAPLGPRYLERYGNAIVPQVAAGFIEAAFPILTT